MYNKYKILVILKYTSLTNRLFFQKHYFIKFQFLKNDVKNDFTHFCAGWLGWTGMGWTG